VVSPVRVRVSPSKEGLLISDFPGRYSSLFRSGYAPERSAKSQTKSQNPDAGAARTRESALDYRAVHALGSVPRLTNPAGNSADSYNARWCDRSGEASARRERARTAGSTRKGKCVARSARDAAVPSSTGSSALAAGGKRARRRQTGHACGGSARRPAIQRRDSEPLSRLRKKRMSARSARGGRRDR
jgi:hypothetical protein